MNFESICLIVALVLFIASLALALYRRRDLAAAMRVFALGIVLTNLVMLLPLLPRIDGLPQGPSNPVSSGDVLRANPVRSFFYALQMGSLDADYSKLLSAVRESATAGYRLFFTVLCVLSPLIFGGFIVTLFEGATARIKYYAFRRVSDVFYFSELNEKSVMLAESVSAHDRKNLVVFCNCGSAGGSPLESRAREDGFVLLAESECALTGRSAHRRYYFEIAENQDENLSRTEKLISCYAAAKDQDICLLKIFLFSEQEEAGFTLSSIDKKGLDVVLVNRDRSVSYSLLLENPLYRALKDGKKGLSVLVVGAGKIGNEIIRACVWCGQLGPEYSLRIQVVDKDAERYRSCLRKECPELFGDGYDISFYQADVETDVFAQILDANCRDVNYIAVCLGDDELSIHTALYLRAWYLGNDPEFRNEPIISVLVGERTKSESLRSFTAIDRERLVRKDIAVSSEHAQNYDLFPFGSWSSIYSHDFIVNSAVEQLALNTHAAYEKMFANGPVPEKDIRVLAITAQYTWSTQELAEISEKQRLTQLEISEKERITQLEILEKQNASQVEILEKQRLTQLEILEKQRITQLEPIVTIHVEENEKAPIPGYIDLVIENVGNGVAKNIRFADVYPKGFTTLSGDPLDKLFIVQNGIQTLAPQHRYVIHMIQLGEKIEEFKKGYLNGIQDFSPFQLRERLKKDLELHLSVTYEDIEGLSKKHNEYRINLCIFWGLRNPERIRRDPFG